MAKNKLDTLLEKANKYPFTSKQYKLIIKDISKIIKDKYRNQYILSVPRGFMQVGHFTIRSNEELDKDFGRDNIFLNLDNTLKFRPRNEIEYDMNFYQIIVGAYITDGEKYVLLSKTDKDKTITFIGGHVDFTPEAYTMTTSEYLILNLKREIEEEVIIKDTSWEDVFRSATIKPVSMINTHDTIYDQYNIGIIFEMRVSDIQTVLKDIDTGEPDKHNVLVASSVEDILSRDNLHGWVEKEFKTDEMFYKYTI